MGPQRHRLHYRPTCVVNPRPIAIGLQIASDKSMEQSYLISSIRLEVTQEL